MTSSETRMKNRSAFRREIGKRVSEEDFRQGPMTPEYKCPVLRGYKCLGVREGLEEQLQTQGGMLLQQRHSPRLGQLQRGNSMGLFVLPGQLVFLSINNKTNGHNGGLFECFPTCWGLSCAESTSWSLFTREVTPQVVTEPWRAIRNVM